MGSIAALKVHVNSIYDHKPAPVPMDDVPNHPGGNVNVNGNGNVNVSHAGGNHDAHDHSHNHGHSHGHDHDHNDSSSGPLRNLPQIQHMLTNASPKYIPKTVAKLAIQTFTELAIAESFTHGTSSKNTVHFHEVGAIDSIVDVIGTLLALHLLNIHSVSSTPLPMGEGTVWTDHGQLPVPAFATMRLMIGMKTCPGPSPGSSNGNGNGDYVTGELVTPTAAALLRVLTGVADHENGIGHDSNIGTKGIIRMGRAPRMTPRAIGIGAGTKDFVKHPNVVRLIIGNDVTMDERAFGIGGSGVPLDFHHRVSASDSVSGDGSGNENGIVVSEHEHAAAFEHEHAVASDNSHDHEHHSHDHEHSSNHSHEHSHEHDSGNDQSDKHQHQQDDQSRTAVVDIDIPPKCKWNMDKLTLLQANLDDITAETLSFAIDILLKNGAVDAWVEPIVMKKGRSAHQLNCLFHSKPGMDGLYMEIIFRHTTTLGIRIQRDVERASLHRNTVQVSTAYGDVNVKIGKIGDEVVSAKAEFDDCKAICEATGVPIQTIANSAVQMAQIE